MSLNSPPRAMSVGTPDKERADRMDISPPPNSIFSLAPSRKKDDTNSKTKTRPRALTSGARTFGRDMSNGASPIPSLPPMPNVGGSQSNLKHTQRSALPYEWMAGVPSPRVADETGLFINVSFRYFGWD
jgi:M-phase inducer tyrosine phosphatase